MFLKKITKNAYIIFIFFFLCLILQNYIFCVLYTSEGYNPWLIDENGNYVLNRVAFNFGQYYENLFNNEKISLDQFGFDLSSSRRPLLPHFILFIYKNFTTNFIYIHLIKNIFFSSIIFLILKTFNKKLNNLFLFICLIFIFYLPHNAVTNLGTENEEGILNYLIIILFFLLISKYKFKNIFLSLVLCLIFFLKGSMFFLALTIPIIIILNEKTSEFKYLPLAIILLTNVYWGYHSYKSSGFVAFGPKGSSMNAINLATVTHKYFNITYPEIRPDIHLDLVENIIKEKKIKNEKDLINELLKQSNQYILQNPLDYFYGVLKKIYVLCFSPFKDTQYPEDPKVYLENLYNQKAEQNKKIVNPIRYSNFPNKIIFNLSIMILLVSIIKYKQNTNYFNKINVYFICLLIFYLAPYMFAWIYPRHATSIYILSHFYILLFAIEKNLFNLKKYFYN